MLHNAAAIWCPVEGIKDKDRSDKFLAKNYPVWELSVSINNFEKDTYHDGWIWNGRWWYMDADCQPACDTHDRRVGKIPHEKIISKEEPARHVHSKEIGLITR